MKTQALQFPGGLGKIFLPDGSVVSVNSLGVASIPYEFISSMLAAGAVFPSGDMAGGLDYCVDLAMGSDDNDGLSWDTPLSSLSAAITLSEASRLGRTNPYIRNKIFARGGATPYAAISSLPNYCDIFGLGAESWGNGTGIPAISGGVAATPAVAGTARGLRFFGFQFIGIGACYIVDFVQFLRGALIDCAFQALTTNTTGGLRFSGSSGGLTILRNKWASGSAGIFHGIGIKISGNNFDQSKIEDNQIGGTTNGICIDATVTQDLNTIWKNNFIGDSGYGCTLAINDNGNPGYCVYDSNSVIGTTSMTLAHRGTARSVNNRCIDGTTGSIFQTGT